eukprot:SAG22_NODE_1748_length_3664_cov_10.806171_4_plen_232_part_00
MCSPTTGYVEATTSQTYALANVAAMGSGDWVTLVLAAFSIGLAIVGELKDIELCSTAVRPSTTLSSGWRYALTFLSVLRRFTLLPGMCTCVIALVIFEGSDALNICFNTVALMFMLEIDSTMFHYGLDENTRARVESAGKIELDRAEAQALSYTKALHVVLVVAAVVLGTIVGGVIEGLHYFYFVTAWSFFFVGAVLEACVIGVKLPLRLARALGHAVLGSMFFFVFTSLF